MIVYDFKEFWIQKYEHYKAEWEELIRFDPFNEWENNTLPETTAEDDFFDGLKILYADIKAELGKKFIERSISIVNKAIKENKFRSDLCKIAYPLNLASALRVINYSKAIIGDVYSKDDLRKAADCYIEWCKQYKKNEWNAQSQAYFLNAVRLLLITNDKGRAKQLIQIDKPFDGHKSEFHILEKISNLNEEIKNVENFLQDEFEDFFNKIRFPEYKPDVFMELDIVRFELGVIKYKYFISNVSEIDWIAAINLVSK